MSSCPQISFFMPAFKPRFFKQANESIFPQTSTEVSTQNDRPGSTRIELFDIIKGIGMFLVVLGHIQCNYGHDPEWIRFLRNWLYQFHIPLFFFISGVLFVDSKAWIELIVNKVKRLYRPFIISNLLFLLADILFRHLTGTDIVAINEIKHTVKLILGITVTPMGGATWFLTSLLRAIIIAKLILCTVPRYHGYLVCLCFALSVFAIVDTKADWLDTTMIPLCYFISGYCCKQLIIPFTAISSGMRIFIAVICTVILLITCTGNRFDIALHVFSNPVLATVCPWVGIVGIICISSLLAELPARPGTLSYIGIHSMSVLIGQFAAFKAVTIIQIAVLPQFDIKCLTAHPCLMISGGWWIAYLLFGLCLPLLFEKYAVIHRQSK